jgi:hypothetical protein
MKSDSTVRFSGKRNYVISQTMRSSCFWLTVACKLKGLKVDCGDWTTEI